jgi:fructokinase
MTKPRVVSKNALVLGELLYDRDVATGRSALGGASANAASRLCELGVNVGFISRVGNDRGGRGARAKLAALGMNTDLIQLDTTYPTGVVDVTRLTSGDATYVIRKNVAYDHIEYTPQVEVAAKQASVFYFGVLVQRSDETRSTIARILRELPRDAIRFLDINLRNECFSHETIAESLQQATHLKLNDEELHDLTGLGMCKGATPIDKAKALCETFNLEIVYLTFGARGAMIIPRTGEVVASPGYKANPLVDTIGSGDAFSASVIADLIAGGIPLQESVDRGCRIATMVAMQKGGFGKLPEGWRTRELQQSVPTQSKIIERARSQGLPR